MAVESYSHHAQLRGGEHDVAEEGDVRGAEGGYEGEDVETAGEMGETEEGEGVAVEDGLEKEFCGRVLEGVEEGGLRAARERGVPLEVGAERMWGWWGGDAGNRLEG